jgi:hypothetical protein
VRFDANLKEIHFDVRFKAGSRFAWPEKHPRFKLHFTPPSASKMNLVERFFVQIETTRIRCGSYASIDDLEDAIYDYLLQHNAKPKPFVWSKTAEDILKLLIWSHRAAISTYAAVSTAWHLRKSSGLDMFTW